jgi:hypothetical protein
MADGIIQSYLRNPPYFGRSVYKHVRDVKQLCGPSCTWDPVQKLWGTKCTEAVQDLIVSNKWRPVGIEHEWKGQFLNAARQYREDLQSRWVAQQEAAKAEAEAAETAAAALKRRTPAAWVLGSSTPKKPKAAPAPAPAPAPATAPSHGRPPKKADPKRLNGVEPTEVEVNDCARLGFTDEAIAFSNILNELGPRGTLSNEGRVLRWCTALTSDARYEVWERKKEDYFDAAVCLKAANEKHLEWAANLNARAAAHAAAALA